jgi:hypothetical protein
MPKVLPNGMSPLNILLKNDDETLCHLLKRIELQTYIGGGKMPMGSKKGKFQGTKVFMILPTSNYQLDIGGGQLIFLQILMLCDILGSQKQCSIKCSRSLQPVQKGFLNMVQTMPSPL